MMETGNEFCFVYSTFPDADSALVVGRTLVERKLAACVNIYPPMTSVYVWQGKQEEGQEVAAFIKTRRSLVDAAVAAARPLHPYTTPASWCCRSPAAPTIISPGRAARPSAA